MGQVHFQFIAIELEPSFRPGKQFCHKESEIYVNHEGEHQVDGWLGSVGACGRVACQFDYLSLLEFSPVFSRKSCVARFSPGWMLWLCQCAIVITNCGRIAFTLLGVVGVAGSLQI